MPSESNITFSFPTKGQVLMGSNVMRSNSIEVAVPSE